MLELAKRWARGTAILFAVGAVSGTVLSFELGLLWPAFMEFAGPIIGLPFSLEGFAFFLEAIFLGVYLYGWDRVPPRVHLASGVVVALSGAASGIFVVRRRALAGAAAVFLTAWIVLTLSQGLAPLMGRRLLASGWALPFHIATGIAALTAIGALWRRSYRLARLAAAAQVSLILWGWLLAQVPYLVPPDLTIAGAAAPARTLELVLLGLAAGFVILVPSLYYLFRVFRKLGRGEDARVG